MNTRFRITFPGLLKLSRCRHRGFTLGLCFMIMTVIMLLSSLLIMNSWIDAKTTKLDSIILETENEITVIGIDFVMDRIDFLATRENGEALYQQDGNYRVGDYNEEYRLRAEYIGSNDKPTKLIIMNKDETAVLLEIEVTDDGQRTVTLWKRN